MNDYSVVVGMSGGVDSSTTAWLLKSKGYRVIGVTVRFLGPDLSPHKRTCCDEIAVARAKEFCRRIGVEHVVVDATASFRRKVIDKFIDDYRAGFTPNPCIICNEKVKFPELEAVANKLGFSYLATGHYARTIRERDGRAFLAVPVDQSKDQSYFLYRVPVRILERTIFPLGVFSKDEVTEMYRALGFDNPSTKESQDVCFLPEDGLREFLTNYLGVDQGKIVDINGIKLGRHSGTHFYTIGQRRGLGISSFKPLYVKRIDAKRKEIVVSTEDKLFSNLAVCSMLKLRTRDLKPPLYAKIRYKHKLSAVEYCERVGSYLKVFFKEPQRAITPGQSLVLYRDGLVLGGGIIVDSTDIS